MNLGYIYSRLLKKIRGAAVSNSVIHRHSKVESGSTVVNSSMDRHSFCGYDCLLNNCSIGAFTSIASNVKIGGSMHPMEYVSTSPVFLSHKDSVKVKLAKHEYYNIPRTQVGNDVWIGEGVFVKSGVNIGNGAVIGMGTIVTKDVPAYSIFCGNPGKVIKYRFEQDLVDELLRSKWWDLPDEKLARLGHLIVDPIAFVQELHRL
ncbi:CatB-related O-acetyltransferase [Shewanella indica]|uniref:CatB-related O-acetyltransferase n=1 Tax=Shewanella indica TaxID=768528 RepID=UPI00313EA493